MKPSEKLAFRMQNQVPRYPPGPDPAATPVWPHASTSALHARSVPQTLWRSAIDQLPRATEQDTGALETVASMMMLRLGTFTRWNPIAVQLALPASFARTSHAVMSRMVQADMFDETLYVLDQLHDCLCATTPPIDYARRRWVFRDLHEPGRGWRQACKAAGIVATERRQQFLGQLLYELLTGSDARFRIYHALPAGEVRVAYKQFSQVLPAELHDFLLLQAEKQLLRHRINEPISWQPTFDYDDGWRAPPPNLERQLAGWESPSRRDTLRQTSREHTFQQLLDAITDGNADSALVDIIAVANLGLLVRGPQLALAVEDLYAVTGNRWTLGSVGAELKNRLQHTLGSEINLSVWESHDFESQLHAALNRRVG